MCLRLLSFTREPRTIYCAPGDELVLNSLYKVSPLSGEVEFVHDPKNIRLHVKTPAKIKVSV